MDRLAALEADVLVTHEAPSSYALIDDLARAMRVKLVAHGHHHDWLDYARSQSRLVFQTFGVGLHGITDRTGQVRVLGELDLNRQGRLCSGRSGDD